MRAKALLICIIVSVFCCMGCASTRIASNVREDYFGKSTSPRNSSVVVGNLEVIGIRDASKLVALHLLNTDTDKKYLVYVKSSAGFLDKMASSDRCNENFFVELPKGRYRISRIEVGEILGPKYKIHEPMIYVDIPDNETVYYVGNLRVSKEKTDFWREFWLDRINIGILIEDSPETVISRFRDRYHYVDGDIQTSLMYRSGTR